MQAVTLWQWKQALRQLLYPVPHPMPPLDLRQIVHFALPPAQSEARKLLLARSPTVPCQSAFARRGRSPARLRIAQAALSKAALPAAATLHRQPAFAGADHCPRQHQLFRPAMPHGRRVTRPQMLPAQS